MNFSWDRRNSSVIKALHAVLWPLMKFTFRLEIHGLENIDSVKNEPALYVSNHNSGALIESHSSLFVIQEKLGKKTTVYGFTHPSIFRIPIMKQYFEWIGAVPATYTVAEEVFKTGSSLMIFPGGNAQALRSVWDYKNNSFRSSHGWAKIALQNKVPVIPISFKGSHFTNPILFSNEWLSKILIIPWLVGLRVTPFSIGQILVAAVVFYLTKFLGANVWVSGILSYVMFVLSPLTIVFPAKVIMNIHPAIRAGNMDDLENQVEAIMNRIYE